MTHTAWFRARTDGQAIHTEGTPSALLGHRIDRGAGQDPDGAFAQWDWDGSVLTAAVDRFGLYPLFYAADENGITIGSSPLLLIAHGVDPAADHRARSAFLRLGFYLGEDTPFRHIKVLPPQGRLRWSPGSIEISGGYYVAPVQQLTEEQIVDAYIELFRESIERRACDPARTIVLVTGGRDSRHILLEMHRQGMAPSLALTSSPYPERADEQPSVAKALAEHCGVEHRTVWPDSSVVRTDMVKNPRAHMLTDEGTWAQMLAKEMNGKADYAYDGLAGDNLSEPRFLTLEAHKKYMDGKLDELAEGIVNKFSPAEESVRAFVPSDHEESYNRDDVLQRVVSELRGCAPEANPYGRFFFRCRARREIALGPYAIFAPIRSYYTPYLDHDVYDLLASIPAEQMLGLGRLHSRVIARAYPEASHIPYPAAGKGMSVSGSKVELAAAIARLGGFCANNRPGRLSTLAQWTVKRLRDRQGTSTMPRRFLQYILQLEAIDRSPALARAYARLL